MKKIPNKFQGRLRKKAQKKLSGFRDIELKNQRLSLLLFHKLHLKDIRKPRNWSQEKQSMIN